ncbi:PREDICTED: uncharacterized protein LOC108769657 [Trachymyrmex cornetzi]|uniref:uncharacterized protein LOC108769657 n=1 Tax=Trachymyrmex cornetzi TaxID=471704 RepID=UPI00084EEB6A|nr:PREDICTED: uncharacterized protein LOC108769657 [Trachymyrmex cornetzi]
MVTCASIALVTYYSLKKSWNGPKKGRTGPTRERQRNQERKKGKEESPKEIIMVNRVLQANINHSRDGHDVLLQTMAEGDFAIAIVSEPYTIPVDHLHLYANERESVAITWRQARDAMPCTPHNRGEHFAAIKWGDMLVAGVYLPPSPDMSQTEEALEELEGWIIQNMDKPIMIAGDFNAKSNMWKSKNTNPRGILVAEWASALGTCCLNQGRKNTCIRTNGESIVDITFTNPLAARRVIKLLVSDRESKSDHCYLEITLSLTGIQEQKRRLPNAKRWATRKMDEDILQAAIMANSWPKRNRDIENIEEQAKQLQKTMTEACDAAMPRAKPRPRRAMPWWSEELNQLRADLSNARRSLRRARRRSRHPEEAESQAKLEDFRQARDKFGKGMGGLCAVTRRRPMGTPI